MHKIKETAVCSIIQYFEASLCPDYTQTNSRAPGGEGNCHGIGEIGLAGNGARREMGKTRNMGWEEGGKHTFSETESGQMMCSL